LYSKCPSKPPGPESGVQLVYYQCDEKLLTAIKDSPAAVEWVKRRDAVGEIRRVEIRQHAGNHRVRVGIGGDRARAAALLLASALAALALLLAVESAFYPGLFDAYAELIGTDEATLNVFPGGSRTVEGAPLAEAAQAALYAAAMPGASSAVPVAPCCVTSNVCVSVIGNLSSSSSLAIRRLAKAEARSGS